METTLNGRKVWIHFDDEGLGYLFQVLDNLRFIHLTLPQDLYVERSDGRASTAIGGCQEGREHHDGGEDDTKRCHGRRRYSKLTC